MKIHFFAMVCLLLSAAVHAETSRVEAEVDKTQVMVDEAVRLTVTAYGDPRRDAFDSSALLNDFVVGRTSTSNRTSLINGKRSQSTSWTTTLFPRKEGTFTIPSFDIEGQQTQPVTIEVVAVPDASDGSQPARDYYLTTEVDDESVYVNQQILYTLKLYLSTDIERGSLTPPELKKGIVRQIGEDERSVDLVNGRRYQIIERKYAIIPQRSGELTIRGPVFTGEVLAPDTNQRFGFFNRTQTINRLGADILVNVEAKPDAVSDDWLPSERVELYEEWPQDGEFVVGEPITRTLTLTATGVVEEQLPELDVRYPPGFKTYPDQSRTATVDRDDQLIAQRVESMAVIPTSPGKIVLPEVTVPWFNVKTKEVAYATIPARSVTVEAANNEQQSALPDTTREQPTTDNQVVNAISDTDSRNAYQGLTPLTWFFGGFSILLLLTLIAVISYYRRQLRAAPQRQTQHKLPASRAEKEAFNQVKVAISQKDVAATQSGLRQWMKQIFDKNPPSRAADNALTAPLQPFIDQMLESAYGNGHTDWDNKSMLATLEQVREKWLSQHNKNTRGLPDLYTANPATSK
ncbi:protein BatD [Salinimonas sp. HHU 13199]|uniref:Protein BatD n=1 Tax=Salinimonas profundi TaxID=2729140 RepID=A0ABR8LFZ4_9ALTE|nr:BatD family protein [Salinimonas profundi]MBD3585175.1 protein BatD [Salinimonas profundi]